jgi:hypothetical protein
MVWRQGGTAAVLEPPGNVEGRVDGAIADQADQQPVADVELPGLPARRQGKAGAHHDGAEHHHRPDTDTLSHPAHGEAAHARAEQGERHGAREDGPAAAEFLGNGLEGDDHDIGSAKLTEAATKAATVISHDSRLLIRSGNDVSPYPPPLLSFGRGSL